MDDKPTIHVHMRYDNENDLVWIQCIQCTGPNQMVIRIQKWTCITTFTGPMSLDIGPKPNPNENMDESREQINKLMAANGCF